MAENPNLETGEVNLFDPAAAACPQPIYRRMLAGCPVARAALTGTPVISRYEDVTSALQNPQIFSSAMDLEIALGTERPMIPQQIDPPAQTKLSQDSRPALLTQAHAGAGAEAVRADANALIDQASSTRASASSIRTSRSRCPATPSCTSWAYRRRSWRTVPGAEGRDHPGAPQQQTSDLEEAVQHSRRDGQAHLRLLRRI